MSKPPSEPEVRELATAEPVAGPPSPPALIPSGGKGSWRGLAVAGVGIVVVLGVLWAFDPTAARIPLCSFYASTGLYCPGCGATRATHEMLHGHGLRALHDNALWALGWPVLSYVLFSELLRSTGWRPLPGDLGRRTGFWITVALVALVFGVLRNLPGEPWSLLAPLG